MKKVKILSDKTKGTLCVIPVISKTGQATLDNHQFLFWSSLVSAVILSLTSILSGRACEIKQCSLQDLGRLMILGLLGTYVYYLFLYFGYSRAIGMEVLVVQYTWPVLIVVLSIFILKERLNYRKVIAVILGFAGVVIVLTKGDFSSIRIGNISVFLLVGAGSFCFALFSVLSKNIRQEPLFATTIYFITACIASFFSMFFYSEFALPSMAEIFPVLLNGIFVNGFSYVCWMAALKFTEASYLAPFTFITPALSAVYLVLFFGEPIIPAYGISLVCVILGGLINTLGQKKTVSV